MADLILYIVLIAIYNVVLFFGYRFGLNVLLFNIVLLLFLIFVLFKKKKINNKYGLLFSIPILILSTSYLLFANIFQVFNVVALPIMFSLLLIYTINPTYNVGNIIGNVFKVLCAPLECIGKFYNVIANKLDQTFKLKKKQKRKIISYLIIIPIVLIILFLLISADLEFRNLFNGIYNVFKDISFFGIIGRILLFIIVFTYLGALINYLLFTYKEEKDKKSNFKTDAYTMKVLLIVLNIIYIVFDFIQIKSLLLHHVGDGIIYSEYARQGFFQLMVISVINISILLFTKRCKEEKLHKIMSLIMVILTFIIICSSIYRMHLYDMAYGYTFLRLMVYTTLVTEILLLIPTIIYIFNSKFKIVKYYLIIFVFMYSLLNLVSIDRIICDNNLKRFTNNVSKELDLGYLENYNYDNIPILYNFYLNCNKEELKEELEDYFITFRSTNNMEEDKLFEYNISREEARKYLDKFYKNYNKATD